MKFEDLDVRKRAARLSADIYKELLHIKDIGFKDQIDKLRQKSRICFFCTLHPDNCTL